MRAALVLTITQQATLGSLMNNNIHEPEAKLEWELARVLVSATERALRRLKVLGYEQEYDSREFGSTYRPGDERLATAHADVNKTSVCSAADGPRLVAGLRLAQRRLAARSEALQKTAGHKLAEWTDADHVEQFAERAEQLALEAKMAGLPRDVVSHIRNGAKTAHRRAASLRVS